MKYREKGSATALFEKSPRLRETLAGSSLHAELRQALKTIQIEDETFFIVEGDLLLDEDDLALYALRRETLKRAQDLEAPELISTNGDKLVGIVEGGRTVRWRPGVVLTFCVLRNTFQSDSLYAEVRENMLQATQEWEDTCGVQFEHVADLDDSEQVRPEGVIFPVRGIDAGGQFIAAAFFPNDPSYRWRILIDPSYFTTSFDRVGVLRHELGHVLGFRHEHIRSGAPPACPDESVWGTINLTDYDPRSVMHYFCGGVGSTALTISELDRIGSQRVYGPSFNNFAFIG